MKDRKCIACGADCYRKRVGRLRAGVVICRACTAAGFYFDAEGKPAKRVNPAELVAGAEYTYLRGKPSRVVFSGAQDITTATGVITMYSFAAGAADTGYLLGAVEVYQYVTPAAQAPS